MTALQGYLNLWLAIKAKATDDEVARQRLSEVEITALPPAHPLKRHPLDDFTAAWITRPTMTRIWSLLERGLNDRRLQQSRQIGGY